jgi:titin
VFVYIVGPPSPPIHPLIGKVLSHDSVELSWQLPEDDGGSPITGYLIEKRDVSRTMWARVEKTDGSTLKLLVKNLNEGSELFFRVSAINKQGQSEALEMPKPIKMKSPFGKILCWNYISSISKMLRSHCIVH